MTIDITSPAAIEAVHTGVESGFALSIWDALMVGRVSATRPGLRARMSDAVPDPNPPVTNHQEVV
jgi:hypothetical protein